jgi:hypothetical protein
MKHAELRKDAIHWWNKKVQPIEKYEMFSLVICPKRSYKYATGREIELIYKWFKGL